MIEVFKIYSNHEIWHTCSNCGEEYDLRATERCPNCKKKYKVDEKN